MAQNYIRIKDIAQEQTEISGNNWVPVDSNDGVKKMQLSAISQNAINDIQISDSNLSVTYGNGTQKKLDIKKCQDLSNYLPLSGGTMSGQIIINTSSNPHIKRNIDNSVLQIAGGSDDKSGILNLYGKNHSSNPGRVELIARDEQSSSTLYGNKDGIWKIDDKNIVRSINGVNADNYGNVNESRTVIFENSSGQGSGDITLTQSWRNFRYLIVVGTDDEEYYVSSHIVDVDSLRYAVDNKKKFLLFCTHDCYWKILAVSSGTTDTFFKTLTLGENCKLFKIIGIK